jgi:GT2 family glycosyltransferase
MHKASRHQTDNGLVSIVIPCYYTQTKRLELLRNCINSVFASTYDNLEVIVVDDCSEIDLSHILDDSILNKITLLRNQCNSGYGFSCNLGATKAKGKYICFLNDDMKVKPNMLEVLVGQINKEENAGVLVCKEVDYDCETQTKATGMFMDRFVNTFPRRDVESGPIFYAPGAPSFMKLDIFHEIGGFDKDYYLFVEDVDLSWRLRLRGYDIIYINNAVVHHHGSATIGSFGPNLLYLYQRNSLTTLIKNCGWKTLLAALSLFTAQSTMLITYFLVKRRFDMSIAIVRAYISNVKNLKSTIAKRLHTQSIRKIRDSYLKNYVWPGWLLLAKKRNMHQLAE